MADPRLLSPSERRMAVSELMKAKAANTTGEKVNFCPFGCGDEELDDNGYCRHLVGFTNDGKTFEPMVRKGGRRVVQVHRDRVEVVEGGEKTFEFGPPVLEVVQKGDQLVKITISSRVYRDVGKELAKTA